LKIAGDRRRNRLTHRHAADIGDNAVGEISELEFPLGCEADQRVLGAAKST
jgi:hypothetical protein